MSSSKEETPAVSCSRGRKRKEVGPDGMSVVKKVEEEEGVRCSSIQAGRSFFLDIFDNDNSSRRVGDVGPTCPPRMGGWRRPMFFQQGREHRVRTCPVREVRTIPHCRPPSLSVGLWRNDGQHGPQRECRPGGSAWVGTLVGVDATHTLHKENDGPGPLTNA